MIDDTNKRIDKIEEFLKGTFHSKTDLSFQLSNSFEDSVLERIKNEKQREVIFLDRTIWSLSAASILLLTSLLAFQLLFGNDISNFQSETAFMNSDIFYSAMR